LAGTESPTPALSGLRSTNARRFGTRNALGCADPPELPEELEGLAAGDILDRSEVLYE
jgi:hypothetical protein